jgi:hypothetical protein
MTDLPTKLIRNSAAKFLIFADQCGEQSINARHQGATVLHTRKSGRLE